MHENHWRGKPISELSPSELSEMHAQMGHKATAPIDLLRELRVGFETEAKHFRHRASSTPDRVEEQLCGAKAFAAEQAVKKIDATLRDWA